MELHFLHPWLVLTAAALAVLAGALLTWSRKFAPFLFTLGAAAFFLSGARPLIGNAQPEVSHALVLDVSGSMDARRSQIDAWLEKLVSETDLPPQHSFKRYELSDALREPGSVHGQGTNYARLADLAADSTINGEIIFVTDGQGPIGKLYEAVNPHRLILLRAPGPERPDASVVSLVTPTSVPAGGNLSIRASVRCDEDARIKWKLLDGDREITADTIRVRGGVPAPVAYNCPAFGNGLQRVKLVVDVPGDRESRNDAATSAFFVGGKRELLYCAPETGFDALLQSLRADQTNHVTVAQKLPLTRGELDSFSVVVINNLSLSVAGATSTQLQSLADWVNGGGNLLMAGTSGAFGPGGYRGSPLEPLMPVRFRPDDSPPRRLLLLLDLSSSMNDPVPGGGSKLQRLKEAARRVLETLGKDDRVAVAGFRERILGEINFLPAGDKRLAARIDGLDAQGSTHIGSSLQQALGAFDGGEHNGILMISDGDDVEHAGENTFKQIGQKLSDGKIRLDVVLTADVQRAWTGWILNHVSHPDAHLWTVGGAGFEGLLETLDKALAGRNREWVIEKPLDASGAQVTLPRLVRTALRKGAGVRQLVQATSRTEPPTSWPLLATRQLIGRTAALCTDSWGNAKLAQFWGDAVFQAKLGGALRFLLEGANRVNLVLNPLGSGAELVWTGHDDPPDGDLQTSAGSAGYASQGRWLLKEWPEGDELRVTKDGRLLQRIPLPSPVPRELSYTGDQPVFFEVAAEGGVRVFNSLGAWKPRRFGEAPGSPTDITWLPALFALLCVICGFAVRKVASVSRR
jgi:hypothetical protein